MEKITYLTEEGAKKLRAELTRLKGNDRENLAKRLRTAIQQGDLSENADYIAAKEEQGFLEGRILELERILQNVQIIEKSVDKSKVSIGSRVTVRESGSQPEVFLIVGPDESDPMQGMISFESPLGTALMNHKVNDTVEFASPSGTIKFTIIKIE